MTDHLFVLADVRRVAQWPLLAVPSALLPERGLTGWLGLGIPWAGRPAGEFGFASSLWPNWMFDDAFRAADPAAAAAQEELAAGNTDDVRRRFRAARAALRFGPSALRLVWYIHAAVLAQRSSRVVLSDQALGRAVWGPDPHARPRGWRTGLRAVLDSLARLHLVDSWPATSYPTCGRVTAVLFSATEVAGSACPDTCPDLGRRHRHIRVDAGPALLGVLEQFARPDPAELGVRRYAFPEGRRAAPKVHRQEADPGPTLRSVGRTGRLTSVFVPAYLGDPDRTAAFTADQVRLVQALVRETTRSRPARNAPAVPETVADSLVPPFARGRPVPCPLLSADSQYVGFNGNGSYRKGHGYRLTSEKGWLARAGYGPSFMADLLADLTALTSPLGLTVVGVGRGNTFHSLSDLAALAGTAPGRQVLEGLHVRAYAGSDYAARWAGAFGAATGPAARAAAAVRPTVDLRAEITAAGLSMREVARQAGVDASFLTKVVNGKKPPPAGFTERVRAALATAAHAPSTNTAGASEPEANPVPAGPACPDLDVNAPAADQAMALRRAGLNVFPQEPATKKPYVRWKPYHDEHAPVELVDAWFRQFPNAGIALAPGPVSGVFAIDVDGTEARQELERRLGGLPVAPTVRSGSGEPDRFHLLFAHPPVLTRPKATPWHPKLEFRGHKGLIVLPPSLHRSGNRYQWLPGRSLADLPLAPPPSAVVAALAALVAETGPTRNRKGVQDSRPRSSARVVSVESAPTPPVGGCSPSTRRFLAGEYADGPEWNDRLFRAACDLAAIGWDLGAAEAALLVGAAPWGDMEAEAARQTVRSAFSKERQRAYR